MKNNEKGFTLVELIVVIAIMGILSAVIIPNFSGAIIEAKERKDLLNIDAIENAAKMYYSINQEYPFNPDVEQTSDNFSDSLDNLEDYIPQVEFDTISNVKWEQVDGIWQITYNQAENGESNSGEEIPPEELYDSWESTQGYAAGDTIVYEDGVYYARESVNQYNNNQPGDMNGPWQEITDEWRVFNVYTSGDTVTYDNGTFIARESVNQWNNNEPGHMNGPWQEITDEWRVFNVYQEGDTVEYEGATFVARRTVDQWNNNEPGHMNGPWQEITDEWRAFNAYESGDQVNYNGNTYIATQDMNQWNNKEPGSPGSKWSVQ